LNEDQQHFFLFDSGLIGQLHGDKGILADARTNGEGYPVQHGRANEEVFGQLC